MKILFQGDSITDASRDRSDDTNLGRGYALLVEAELGYEVPEKYQFINRGIGGDRVLDIYTRMRTDILDIKPDVMSILIGVNDVWHGIAESDKEGIDAEKYYTIYDMLIEDIKRELPELKIMILEPFVLKGWATEEQLDTFNVEVRKRAVMAKKIAEKYNLPFIPLQEGFTELSKKAEESYWLYDGVHPTIKGHEYIKREWLKTFNKLQ